MDFLQGGTYYKKVKEICQGGKKQKELTEEQKETFLGGVDLSEGVDTGAGSGETYAATVYSTKLVESILAQGKKGLSHALARPD